MELALFAPFVIPNEVRDLGCLHGAAKTSTQPKIQTLHNQFIRPPRDRVLHLC